MVTRKQTGLKKGSWGDILTLERIEKIYGLEI